MSVSLSLCSGYRMWVGEEGKYLKKKSLHKCNILLGCFTITCLWTICHFLGGISRDLLSGCQGWLDCFWDKDWKGLVWFG